MVSFVFFVVAVPALATCITISPNGNSPEVKMLGGMMVDIQQGFVPMTTPAAPATAAMKKSSDVTSDKLNSTKLSINERYRRLIPYMTFYYANDLKNPPTESYAKTVEVEKAEIIEAPMIDRQPKKVIQSYRNIPRYQGNRFQQYDIKYKEPVRQHFQAPPLRTQSNYNGYFSGHNLEEVDFRPVFKPYNIKLPSVPFATRKPYLDGYRDETPAHYIHDKQKYKLVPYEQTPPVKIIKEEFKNTYLKPIPPRPQYSYNPGYIQLKKPPSVVSENYYEHSRPLPQEPVIEGGFKPMLKGRPTESPIYLTTESEALDNYRPEKPNVQIVQTEPAFPTPQSNYYQEVTEQPIYKYKPASNKITLADLIKSLQLKKTLPKEITTYNVGSSIQTLLSHLSAIKAAPELVEPELVLSSPKPYEPIDEVVSTAAPAVTEAPTDLGDSEDLYLAPVNPPSQHIDEEPPYGFTSGGSTSQRFPQRAQDEAQGGTPGRPGADYPTLAVIPNTAFSCKTQRYKGFFADPETRCQVWHYCDLNGGQASFLCPNGTIFSQAALTCDWWFNVRCAAAAQLYVLNESLYKYILPHSPTFPEDYSGPLVDKYLTLKFKEMEEQFRKNKNKQSAAEADDSDDSHDPDDVTSSAEEAGAPAASTENEVGPVSEASVVVETSGNSGNVQRLQDE